eukprot:5735758-Amphidinium_carterae.1
MLLLAPTHPSGDAVVDAPGLPGAGVGAPGAPGAPVDAPGAPGAGVGAPGAPNCNKNLSPIYQKR